jgi:AAA+ ATPase superfamily predicted ATPase
MGIQKIIGRTSEKTVLESALRSNEAEFIAVYGRRRVGKTHLIRNYFEDSICFEMVGEYDGTLKDQLKNFAYGLSNATGMGIQLQPPTSWSEAFRQLEQYLESPMVKGKGGKRIVFLDELPWINTPRSKFLPSLEHFWNAWAVKQPDVILVVCGSAASWMIQNIIRARGGLHNRLSRQIRLLPFTLAEAETFLVHRGVELTRNQIVELYMVIGGVPHYLKMVEPGYSTAQIIDNICFSSTGALRDEFSKLYASLFDDSDQHMKIITMLAKKRRGLSRNEILKPMGVSSGGSLTRRLDELEESGFIISLVPIGKQTKDALYRLVDEYSLFYLDWIRPLGRRSPNDGYWLSRQNTPKKRAWAGYSFENLCLKQVRRIKAALGVEQVETIEAPWYYRPNKDSTLPGAQIDLLIDRRDQTINLCEMKYSESEFTITKKYADDLRRKRHVFKEVTGTKKNVFITMVTTFGLVANTHSRELVANSLTLKNLF